MSSKEEGELAAMNASKDWLTENRESFMLYGPMQFAAMAFSDGAAWQARAQQPAQQHGNLGDLKEHAMNCPDRGAPNWQKGKCTCHLEWRIKFSTEREMHNAWRKRAEEAEAALAAMSPQFGSK